MNVKAIVEAALMASGRPLTIAQLQQLFTEDKQPKKDDLKDALIQIEQECHDKGYELKQLATGYQFQTKAHLSPWVARLWEEKPTRLSKVLLETLAIIAYRQPVTRAEIEDIRGVATSAMVIKSLTEYGWIKVIAHRDIPGKPALFGTTDAFLAHFNLKSIHELPDPAELVDNLAATTADQQSSTTVQLEQNNTVEEPEPLCDEAVSA